MLPPRIHVQIRVLGVFWELGRSRFAFFAIPLHLTPRRPFQQPKPDFWTSRQLTVHEFLSHTGNQSPLALGRFLSTAWLVSCTNFAVGSLWGLGRFGALPMTRLPYKPRRN